MHQSGLVSRRVFLVGAGSIASSGCFGSFGATRGLWEWNDELGNKWVKWLVFLGLSIIPVYELFVLADTLVLNSVEFWTGSNPVRKASDGRTLTRVATADPDLLRIELRRDEQLEQVFYFRRNAHGVFVFDHTGRIASIVTERSDGSVELHAADGQLLAQLDRGAMERSLSLVTNGQAVRTVLQHELGGAYARVAHFRSDPAPSVLGWRAASGG
ncbi:MAG TPA: DUF3332 domain-containing protein [Polyangiaceae bacterium]|nr:DUF3332 domain-containing protein [Polyangiaceae bacterium]